MIMARAHQPGSWKPIVAILVVLLGLGVPALARDVAFVEPGSAAGTVTADDAFKIEPKSDIDIGDSIINIVRRQSLFFINQTPGPIKIEKITLSSDSTVNAAITNDDCSKEGILAPMNRCSIELSITPSGPGSWGIELLMTHNGPGRITRAKISGKTAGSDSGDKKEHGLFLSSKDTKQVEFGEVTVGDGKIVRSALMVNDSSSPITIYSIDVVEADKSLQRLDTGCAADLELKPGESCPVTLVWQPTDKGVVSTDLIIRHSGQLGFAVIPVRGTAKGPAKENGDDGRNGKDNDSPRDKNTGRNDAGGIPVPPTPNQVAKEVQKAIGGGPAANISGAGGGDDAKSAATGHFHLIGTVGSRAVLLKPDGTTAVVQAGDVIDADEGQAKVLNLGASTATLMIGDKKKELKLEAVKELKDRAAASRKDDNSNGGGPGGASGVSVGGPPVGGQR